MFCVSLLQKDSKQAGFFFLLESNSKNMLGVVCTYHSLRLSDSVTGKTRKSMESGMALSDS